MQGLEAGYIAGLGTIAGNLLWIGSLIFGLRFIVIPWLSLDILRYLLGFILLVKYMWDSYSEKRVVLEDLSKKKIFVLNFLLAFTEQTNIYPFLSNLSISSDSTFLESFPADSFGEFVGIHGCYLLGIFLGSFSLLQFTCWFLENPAFNLYMWMVSSFKITTGFYYKVLNFVFLYLTMICAISSVSYFALDYTVTNPLGFVHEDRLFDQKGLLETAFLNTKASDRNTRRNRGRHGRRERWKRRVRRYRTFDASLYDQGVYDLFTIEDLNYGFDRFWLRRKMRNHRVHFRFFPGPWMRSFKKQLSRPRLESFMGPRVEFFRILFEQAYHPEFHEFNKNHKKEFSTKTSVSANRSLSSNDKLKSQMLALQAKTNLSSAQQLQSIYSDSTTKNQKQGLIKEYSALRKFIRKVNTRVKASTIISQTEYSNSSFNKQDNQIRPIYSKKWKYIFSKISHQANDSKLRSQENLFRRLYNSILLRKQTENTETNTSLTPFAEQIGFMHNKKESLNNSILDTQNKLTLEQDASKKLDSLEKLSKKDRQILRYKTFLIGNSSLLETKNASLNKFASQGANDIETLTEYPQKTNQKTNNETSLISQNSSDKKQLSNTSFSPYNPELSSSYSNNEVFKPLTLFHPVKFYLKKEQAFQRKLKFYGANIYRTFGVENNAPYFRTMMQRFFYYYKPTLRWERTMRTATMRKARRKGPRVVRKLNVSPETKALSLMNPDLLTSNTAASAPLQNNSLFAEAKSDQKDQLQKLETQKPMVLNDENRESSMLLSNTTLQKPTHFYSLVSKRASRYRWQIYKDVLQHWYYSPFNRLLLKFDVDSFIRRQPTSYFLTKNEEQLLHLRRFLLAEHYETLRWYTYMQHYRSMKTRIGGTKSFASRLYSQQFMGTFKKVRHLFALTPSSSENTILKFDQPLYNEYANTQTKSILADSFLHEELLADDDIFISKDKLTASAARSEQSRTNQNQYGISESDKISPVLVKGDDLPAMSTKIIRNYLIEASPLREELIKKLLAEKNYWELTTFLFKGQKTRGETATTNERQFLNQEKDYLYNAEEKVDLEKFKSNNLDKFFKQKTGLVTPSYTGNATNAQHYADSLSMVEFQQNLWIELLKKCQNTLYDQESLKNYLLKHVDKRKKQQERQEKYLNLRLQRLKNWFFSPVLDNKKSNLQLQTENELTGLTTGIQKGVKEGIFFQKGFNMSSLKSNIRNNMPQVDFSSKTTQIEPNNLTNNNVLNDSSAYIQKNQFDSLKDHLTDRLKLKQMQVLTIEQDLKESLKSTKSNKATTQGSQLDNKTENLSVLDSSVTSSAEIVQQQPKYILGFIYKTLTPFSNLSKQTVQTIFIKPLNLIKKLRASEFDQNMNSWRKQEIALAKRKKTRKTLKRLRNQNRRNLASNTNTSLSTENLLTSRNSILSFFESGRINLNKKSIENPNRQKRDVASYEVKNQSEQLAMLENQRRMKSWDEWTSQNNKQTEATNKVSAMSIFQNLTAKKFKRKRSRLRRYRRLKSRGPIKKRTLAEKLKRQFKLLKRYSRASEGTTDLNRLEKKVELFKLITKRKYEPKSEFVLRDTKQRRTRLSKQRFWKQKKQKYAQNKRKLRKRRRYAAGKIRTLFKEYKRKESTLKVKQWWWENFLPNFRATIDANWQVETDRYIQNKLSSLSDNDILARDELMSSSKTNTLQIGDKDYKPLATPQAIRIRKNLENQGLLSLNNTLTPVCEENCDLPRSALQPASSKDNDQIEKLEETTHLWGVKNQSNSSELDVIAKVTQNTFLPESLLNLKNIGIETEQKLSSVNQGPLLTSMNPVPFYAGWDETLRKFVITNRFLSIPNQQLNYNSSLFTASALCSLSCNDKSQQKGVDTTGTPDNANPTQNQKQNEFVSSPLRGMNAATTLYWQVPFTTYDPDQFFALGMDGFSPIGWRRFHFRHSKQTTKPILVQSKTQTNQMLTLGGNTSLSYSIQQKMVKKPSFKTGFDTSVKNMLRRSQKRYKRVKKHPRPPVWFPSGPLTNQVLPVHYIYVFYKRYRLPRDRYIRRRLRRNDKTDFLSNGTVFTKYTDFTLRKRAKPRRKYHRKRHFYKNDNLILKRRAFRSFVENVDISRPTPPNFITESRGEMKQKRKLSGKQSPENLRIRQLRRRVQRQVIRPVWRYRPRAGGYTWPGDYLRLELVKAPILNSTNASISSTTTTQTKIRKTRKKKRKTIQEWQIQPKKYLLQKHNLRVLRKRLEKSQNSNKIYQRSKELSYLLNQE